MLLVDKKEVLGTVRDYFRDVCNVTDSVDALQHNQLLRDQLLDILSDLTIEGMTDD